MTEYKYIQCDYPFNYTEGVSRLFIVMLLCVVPTCLIYAILGGNLA